MSSLLSALNWLVWRDPTRRAQILLRFAEVEADGGRDLVRAAELTQDPTLRRLFLKHAADEARHAELFRGRGLALLKTLPQGGAAGAQAEWLAPPGERGLDDLHVEQESTGPLLAFLHLSEKAAARDFGQYIKVLDIDPPTQGVFAKVLHDEAFHMNYTRAQLARVSPEDQGRLIWRARGRRVWRAYLRLAAGLAGLLGSIILTLQYFILLPPFAIMAKQAARREVDGWKQVGPGRSGSLERQY